MYTKEKISNSALNAAGLIFGSVGTGVAMKSFDSENTPKAIKISLGVIIPIAALFGIPSGAKKIDVFTRGAINGMAASIAYRVGEKIFNKKN